MKFGLQHPSFSYNYSNYQDTLKELALFAERTGFDSFWVMDHFHQISVVGKPYEPMLEGWTTISFLAAVTTKIGLGCHRGHLSPSVCTCQPRRNSWCFKWRQAFFGYRRCMNEEESCAYGIPFPSTEARFLMLEEALQIIRGMWIRNSRLLRLMGGFISWRMLTVTQNLSRNLCPPILVGGSGEKKTLKIVAKHADACNLFGSSETIKRKLEALFAPCKSIGRNYKITFWKQNYPMLL